MTIISAPGGEPPLTSTPGSSQRFWWVSHNQTHRQEISGGFMWSPKANANRARNQFYENMRLVRAGDIVFSFYDGRVQAIGIVTTTAETTPKPHFGAASQSNNWSDEGWLVGVEFETVSAPFRPRDHIEALRTLLPEKYSPLGPTGDGLQSVYLAEISDELAQVLIDLSESEPPRSVPEIDLEPEPEIVSQEDSELAELQGRTDIGDTQRAQLIKARRRPRAI